MKAIVISEFGPADSLKIADVTDPTPKSDEILIRVRAAGLNNADLLQREGRYPPPPSSRNIPANIPGLEVAGEVEAAGDEVRAWKKGDRVMALLTAGGYAEKISVPAAHAMTIPKNLTFEEAAAIPEAFLTAYLELVRLAHVHRGENVLIHAGASGVGTAAIQIAKELNTRVFVTASSEDKLRFCESLGADVLINYRTEDFAKKVLEGTQNIGVNCILDLVGAVHFHKNLQALAVGGRLLLVGLSGGAAVEKLDLRMILTKRLQIIGSTLRARSDEEKAYLIEEFQEYAAALFGSKRLRPVVDKVFPFRDVIESHRYLESKANKGKVVLTLKE